jgi:TetR/AcrR family fatty acid metabolism transcriptional regulator
LVEEKKESILKAAEALFSGKGFNETKISDIARESGIHEASIYSYFNNKRNILFAIYGRYLRNVVTSLKEHFLGMKEPGPKLRKTIWHYLADIKNNPNYSRILMMAQRENPDFYASEYNDYLKEFSNLVFDIVIDGQNEGFFRRDISARLIRNMALGTCVFEGFDSVVFTYEYDPDEMSDIIYSMVINAAAAEVTPAVNRSEKIKRNDRAEYRKAQIIETAMQVFSAKGFSNATISDIAKQACLGDATLYEYFDNKEAILLAISETYMQNILSNEAHQPQTATDPEKALRRLIWQWIWQIYSHEDFSRLLVLDLLRNISFYSTPGYLHLKAFKEKLLEVVERGKNEGVFINNLPCLTYFHMVIGTFDQFLIGQYLLKSPALGLADLNITVDTLVRAIKIPEMS